ncbi:MAG TPA: hypothetical protein VFB12_03450 [Ktedonobacteraceae bacterium]|nr:hypothetical protein [Ktedonobacteraceae bacterium]
MSDHIPTLADVCSAIAEGRIAAAVDGSMYQVNALELRRYLNRLRPLPTISPSGASASPFSDSGKTGWSCSDLCSLGR